MVELLRVLADWLNFFFINNRYRLDHSQVGPSSNDALIEFVSGTLRWRLVRDRSQVLLSCRPSKKGYKESEWYSADIIIRFITEQKVDSAVLTQDMAAWFERNLSEIEQRFSTEQLDVTIAALKRLEQLRSKEHFD